MYKIFQDTRHFIIDNDACRHSSVETVRVSPSSGPLEMTKLLQKLQNTKQLLLLSDNPEELFSEFSSLFTPVDAAGGVAVDDTGRVLMIFRNSRWDLPKGKREEGEEVTECARREIEEECGIGSLSVVKPLTETWHIYDTGGDWVLKHTYWFLMRHAGREFPVPQREEGITVAEWVEPHEIEERIKDTFPTIREVFASAGML